MKTSLLQLIAATAMAVSLFAQAPAALAAAATAQVTCKDGTKQNRGKGACQDHGGVSKKAKAKPANRSKASPTRAQAPGGGADKVWANTSSKNYHCQGAKFYGKTRVGEYMAEADAKAQGYRGKACASTAGKA